MSWLCQAWDEEFSLAAQLQTWQDEAVYPPGPGELPLPFSMSEDATVYDPNAGQGVAVDWLELFRDKRVLRGGRRLGCVPVNGTSSSTWSPASSSSSSLWDGGNSAHGTASSSSSPLSTATSSSTAPCPDCSSSSTSSSPASSLDDPPTTSDEGIIKRWGVYRPGRGRWHNPDGTVKRREARPSLVPVPEEPHNLDDNEPFNIVDVQHGEETTVKAVTFYGEHFAVRAEPGFSLSGHENSTTAGEDVSENSTASSSNASEPPSVGFWHHGQWINRPRTPEEQRRHVGGRGMRRTLKEARMAVYLRGEWKPRWLEEYIQLKKVRENAPAPHADPPCDVPSVSTLDSTLLGDEVNVEETGNTSHNPWADLGWWSQSEWEQWWSWNGVNSPDIASTTSTTSALKEELPPMAFGAIGWLVDDMFGDLLDLFYHLGAVPA
eukprot:s5146_g6.t1